MRCQCDGRYDRCEHGDVCYEEAGGGKSPHFCAWCDRQRIEGLTVEFARLRASFSDLDEPRGE